MLISYLLVLHDCGAVEVYYNNPYQQADFFTWINQKKERKTPCHNTLLKFKGRLSVGFFFVEKLAVFQTQAAERSSKQSTQFPATSRRTCRQCEPLRKRQSTQVKTHHRSHVSVLSLLTGGSRQALQRRQTFFGSKEGKVMRGSAHLRSAEKNPQTYKYGFFAAH